MSGLLSWILSILVGVLALMTPGAARADEATTGAQASSPPPGRRPPNVILMVIDDMGYGDLGCYGAKDVQTPNIDSIATAGVRFTHGYVTAPMCSPSRAAILTGRYQQRFGHEFNPFMSESPEFGLPVGERTLADELKAVGYRTGIVGKWHLGLHLPYQPQNRGFDEFFGFRGGRHIYSPDPRYRSGIVQNDESIEEKEYLTHAFSREAVSFIERHRAGPFFLYLSYNAIHTPLQAPEEYLRRFAHVQDEGRRMGCAMISALDDGVGRVLQKLRELKLEEETIVFFVSDNGGQLTQNASSNGGLAGGKNDLNEGGIRVPFLMQWKGTVPGNQVYAKPVVSMDCFATAVAAAGVKLPGDRVIDGVDLLPFLGAKTDAAASGNGPAKGAASATAGAPAEAGDGEDQEEAEPHEALYWRVGQLSAIRKGKWKLIKMRREPAMLFDVRADPGEKKDLSGRQPQAARRLERQLKQWSEEMAEPRWPNPEDPSPAVQKQKRILMRQAREEWKAKHGATTKPAAEMDEGEEGKDAAAEE